MVSALGSIIPTPGFRHHTLPANISSAPPPTSPSFTFYLVPIQHHSIFDP